MNLHARIIFNLMSCPDRILFTLISLYRPATKSYLVVPPDPIITLIFAFTNITVAGIIIFYHMYVQGARGCLLEVLLTLVNTL